MNQSYKQKNPRLRRNDFTPLGKIFYLSKASIRLKIQEAIVDELGLKKWYIRQYLVTTPAFRMRADVRQIVLRFLPEAEPCFADPRVQTSQMA